jgi:hypothetical protein
MTDEIGEDWIPFHGFGTDGDGQRDRPCSREVSVDAITTTGRMAVNYPASAVFWGTNILFWRLTQHPAKLAKTYISHAELPLEDWRIVPECRPKDVIDFFNEAKP